MPAVRSLLTALVIALVLVLPATKRARSQALEPLVVGWEQYFTINWSVGERRGRPVVYGRIYNKWNFGAANMRLLVEELDSGGRIVDQQLGWLGFALTPGTTAPFEIPVAHNTPNHRVRVFSWDWVQTDGRGWRF